MKNVLKSPNKIKSVLKGNRWTPALLKKVLGKVVTIGFIDTTETETGFCFLAGGSEPKIAYLNGKGQLQIDSPGQVVRIHEILVLECQE